MSPRRVSYALGFSLIPLLNLLQAADIQAMVNGTGTNGFKPLVKDDRPSTPVVAPASKEGEIRIRKSEITSREKGLSGMPEGLGQLLSRQELRDVLEFLGTLK